jgi:hypothetical protein
MYQLIANTGYFFLLLNLILYIIGFSKFGKAYKIFTAYLALLVAVQLICVILLYCKKVNLFMSHFYFVGQLILLAVFYFLLVKDVLKKKIILTGTCAGLVVLAVQYFFDPSMFFKFNLLEITITSLLVVFFALLHLYDMLTDKKEYYFITVGIIIYLLASTILFLVGNLTIGLSENLKFLSWTLNAVLVLVNQLFILYEWKKSFYKKTISQSKSVRNG